MLLEKDNCCLLLVDVQEKLASLIDNHTQVIHYCEWMLKLATRLDIPILVSEQYPKGLGSTIKSLEHYQSSNGFPLCKLSFSCWDDPDFQHAFNALNKQQVVLIGIETHVCILQTALQLLDQGIEVFLVAEATGSRQANDKYCALERMRRIGVQIITAEMAFFEWIRVAGTPEFKQLSREFLRTT